MIALYRLLCIPAIIPYYGLISTISGYIALWRYWGDWGIFILLLVLGGMKDSGTTSLAEIVKEQGNTEYAMGVAAGCCVLQTLIIAICIASFT